MFEVRVSAAVARLREDGSGSRRVVCYQGTEREQVLEFTRHPIRLEEVPPEVAADEHLIVTPIEDPSGDGAGAELKPGRIGGASTEELQPGRIGGAATEELKPGRIGGASTEELKPGRIGGASTEELKPGRIGGAATEEGDTTEGAATEELKPGRIGATGKKKTSKSRRTK